MVKGESKEQIKKDLAFQRLLTNYENHSKQNDESFKAIKEQLFVIEAKVDRWTWKIAGIGGGMGIIASIMVLLISKLLGG